MEADLEGCRRNVARNLGMATALAPVLGYDVAATVAKAALASGRTVREEAALHPQAAALGAERLDALLDPARMARPHPG
jgi:fumarate hydratase class II